MSDGDIYSACESGDLQVVQQLLAEDPALAMQRDEADGTPLHLAARKGDARILAALLDAGADVDAQDDEGRAALFYAAQSGNPDAVRLLLDRGADPALEEREGGTALHAAATLGHAQVASLLLERGASPNATDQDGATPLYFAAHHGHEDVARVLLNAGADPRIANSRGWTPRYWAEYGGHDAISRLLAASETAEAATAQPEGAGAPGATEAAMAQAEGAGAQDTDVLRRCLSPEYLDATEPRSFRDDGSFGRYLDAFNSQHFEEALSIAQDILPRYQDFDLAYHWVASTLMQLGRADEALRVASEGVPRVRRKSLLLNTMAEAAWRTGAAEIALWALTQSIHAQREQAVIADPYLQLSVVAEALGLTEQAAALLTEHDSLRAGRVRMSPDDAAALSRVARTLDPGSVREIVDAIILAYIAPPAAPEAAEPTAAGEPAASPSAEPNPATAESHASASLPPSPTGALAERARDVLGDDSVDLSARALLLVKLTQAVALLDAEGARALLSDHAALVEHIPTDSVEEYSSLYYRLWPGEEQAEEARVPADFAQSVASAVAAARSGRHQEAIAILARLEQETLSRKWPVGKPARFALLADAWRLLDRQHALGLLGRLKSPAQSALLDTVHAENPLSAEEWNAAAASAGLKRIGELVERLGQASGFGALAISPDIASATVDVLGSRIRETIGSDDGVSETLDLLRYCLDIAEKQKSDGRADVAADLLKRMFRALHAADLDSHWFQVWLCTQAALRGCHARALLSRQDVEAILKRAPAPLRTVAWATWIGADYDGSNLPAVLASMREVAGDNPLTTECLAQELVRDGHLDAALEIARELDPVVTTALKRQWLTEDGHDPAVPVDYGTDVVARFLALPDDAARSSMLRELTDHGRLAIPGDLWIAPLSPDEMRRKGVLGMVDLSAYEKKDAYIRKNPLFTPIWSGTVSSQRLEMWVKHRLARTLSDAIDEALRDALVAWAEECPDEVTAVLKETWGQVRPETWQLYYSEIRDVLLERCRTVFSADPDVFAGEFAAWLKQRLVDQVTRWTSGNTTYSFSLKGTAPFVFAVQAAAGLADKSPARARQLLVLALHTFEHDADSVRMAGLVWAATEPLAITPPVDLDPDSRRQWQLGVVRGSASKLVSEVFGEKLRASVWKPASEAEEAAAGSRFQCLDCGAVYDTGHAAALMIGARLLAGIPVGIGDPDRCGICGSSELVEQKPEAAVEPQPVAVSEPGPETPPVAEPSPEPEAPAAEPGPEQAAPAAGGPAPGPEPDSVPAAEPERKPVTATEPEPALQPEPATVAAVAEDETTQPAPVDTDTSAAPPSSPPPAIPEGSVPSHVAPAEETTPTASAPATIEATASQARDPWRRRFIALASVVALAALVAAGFGVYSLGRRSAERAENAAAEALPSYEQICEDCPSAPLAENLEARVAGCEIADDGLTTYVHYEGSWRGLVPMSGILEFREDGTLEYCYTDYWDGEPVDWSNDASITALYEQVTFSEAMYATTGIPYGMKLTVFTPFELNGTQYAPGDTLTFDADGRLVRVAGF